MSSSASIAPAPAANIVQSNPPAVSSRQSADYDTAYPIEVRKYLRTYGLTPPAVESFETQEKRCLQLLENKQNPIDKYQYLTHLRNTNVNLFYRLLSGNVKEITPVIYTPTVGEACQRWSEIYTQPEGMYLSFSDKGNLHSIIQNWPHNVEITVVTDGSRILGLGDLGINGMGIPQLRNDPLYMGSRRDKVTADEEREFLDELMAALTERWPGIVIQYEDFKNPFPSLERYQNTYTMFNDDIQGTGAVILGGFINGVKQSKVAAADQRAVFFGAGSAGVGVAKQLVEFFMNEGLTEDQARKCFWLVDSKGLITNDRGDKLAEHKLYFSRDDNEGQQYKTLEDVIEYVKPTILMGLSTIGGAFTPEIIKRMAELNKMPDAIKYTEGRVLFASGSPFPALEYNGQTLEPGQGNNMYVFPGVGLGAILSKAVNVTQSMIYASGKALSESLLPEEIEKNWMYPDIRRIREVSVVVTCGVIRAAQEAGVDRELGLRNMDDKALTEYVQKRMYDPFTEGKKVQDEVKELASHLSKL
ncbi:unnamed protein product [Aureobasidium vineae]|uniref:Malic enzyme n=1 Tax=Aureobasidium vineae TaxID=2773715 RepID=A0A9N8J9R1_9PEZI|nr:unnamed protein product [Aureobasidium vineae]